MTARDERLRAGLAAWGIDEDVVALAGDASTRRYVRAGRHGTSVVVMDMGAAIPAQAGTGDLDPFPFTRWQRFYDALGIRVPQVLAIDHPRGLVLLEDLGDELLQHEVESVGPGACRAHYLRAVEHGLRLARDGTARFVPDADGSDDPLVPARLAVEMDLFLVHAAGVTQDSATAGLPPLVRAARALDDRAGAVTRARSLLHALCVDVHGERDAPRPMALCHRDYHARNLLLVPATPGERGAIEIEEVAVIDFQDTRRGPRAYDLASLAWDPYVTLPDALVAELVEAWRPTGTSRDAWHDEVALAAGQRLIKAAGSYAWLGHGCGRVEYLRWLEPALSRARERLALWPRRDELWDALRVAGALGA